MLGCFGPGNPVAGRRYQAVVAVGGGKAGPPLQKFGELVYKSLGAKPKTSPKADRTIFRAVREKPTMRSDDILPWGSGPRVRSDGAAAAPCTGPEQPPRSQENVSDGAAAPATACLGNEVETALLLLGGRDFHRREALLLAGEWADACVAQEGGALHAEDVLPRC